MKIHIKCSEFGWVKNVTERRRGGEEEFRSIGLGLKSNKVSQGSAKMDDDNQLIIPTL